MPRILPAAMAPPEASLSATIPAVVEELSPDDFQTVEAEEHRFSEIDEQTRSILYTNQGEEFGLGSTFTRRGRTLRYFKGKQRLLLL